jgi:hypothetical protein
MKNPQQQSNPNVADSAAAQAQANQASVAFKPDVVDARSFTVRADGSVLLIKPRLELHGDLMQKRGDVTTLKRIWEPEQAIIAGGMIIIEEWSVFLPLPYLHAGYWSPPKTDAKTS